MDKGFSKQWAKDMRWFESDQDETPMTRNVGYVRVSRVNKANDETMEKTW